MNRMTSDKNHVDEALWFETIVTDSTGRRGDGVYRREKSPFVVFKRCIEEASKLDASPEAQIKASAAFKTLTKYERKISIAVGSGADLAGSFNALMDAVFKSLQIPIHKYSAEIFKLTGISDKVFRDMRSGARLPSHRTIVALCAGLDLEIAIAEQLLALCGKAFSQTDEHRAFRMILTKYRGSSITRCNDILEALEFSRLTDDK